MKFKDFLKENKEKHAVLAFGRMNPPTTGHGALVDKVHEIAKKHNASHHVVLSHTQDKQKNPLSSEQKLKHAKRFFPKTNLSLATKEEPNFLTQAAKLHKQGVTHLHMVAGSDRVPEYHKLLHKYNGTHKDALYNFKKIEVHSAGERDPDAEGVSGMSASKMRSHASSGNYNEFKKGIPSHVHEKHAKELYNDVRKNMNIKEDTNINEDFNAFLNEGVHDKGIFKAVFLAGGPGSGKDYVLSNTLDGQGLIEINSDKALEYLMDKEGLDKTMPESEKEKRDFIRTKAKNLTDLRNRLALIGRNGLIINGTGDSVEKINKIKSKLEELGYETAMILVNTADEVSQQRNIERGKKGGRTVPEEIRKEKWDAVQNSRPELAKLFGQNYMEFDNSEDLRNAPPEVVKQKKEEMQQLFVNVKNFIDTEPSSEQSQDWIAGEMQKKDTLPVQKGGVEQTAHPDSQAAEQAARLGLEYYGFGRYGRNGEVLYRVVHDRLVDITKQRQQTRKTEVKAKPVNEDFNDFLNESVSITISGDTPEEVSQMLNRFKHEEETNEDIEEENESTFSDNSVVMALTLGKGLVSESANIDEMAGANMDTRQIHSHLKKQGWKLSRTSGGHDVFTHEKAPHHISVPRHKKLKAPLVLGILRSSKVKEEYVQQNMEFSKKFADLQERLQGSRISESDGDCGRNASDKISGKITIKEIWSRKKKKVEESIDKNIEPGVSMAGSGESLGRDTGEKIRKSRGKASQVDENIGDGGEIATSMSDKNEDDLKKKGINLTTFKAKRPIG